MTSVIFVHGTSVREPGYTDSFDKVKKALEKRKPGITVVRCSWGEEVGAKLNRDGSSIPHYDSTRGSDSASKKEIEMALWGLLYEDPLYELQLLSLRQSKETSFVAGRRPPWKEFDRTIRGFKKSPELQEKLDEAGIATQFDKAWRVVINSRPYRESVRVAPQAPAEYRAALARATVAQIRAQSEQPGQQGTILMSATLRDEIVQRLIEDLGGTDRSIGGWVSKQLRWLSVKSGVMDRLKNRRGRITDKTYPFAGDVLLYQARGENIRAFVRKRIEEATPPVVLLAHSLGGIICFDLLVMNSLPKVDLLVTVGSQAPFLYEINALQSLPFDRSGDPLPDHFPRWLNIYDPSDFLSYVGAKVFPGRVTDVKVNNEEPFPWSHSAYWETNALWDEIVKQLPSI